MFSKKILWKVILALLERSEGFRKGHIDILLRRSHSSIAPHNVATSVKRQYQMLANLFCTSRQSKFWSRRNVIVQDSVRHLENIGSWFWVPPLLMCICFGNWAMLISSSFAYSKICWSRLSPLVVSFMAAYKLKAITWTECFNQAINPSCYNKGKWLCTKIYTVNASTAKLSVPLWLSRLNSVHLMNVFTTVML